MNVAELLAKTNQRLEDKKDEIAKLKDEMAADRKVMHEAYKSIRHSYLNDYSMRTLQATMTALLKQSGHTKKG